MSERINRDDCFICGDGHPDILERHHIVPARFGGTDDPRNLVDLCPSCHAAIEKIHDKRFYDAMGVTSPDPIPEGADCFVGGCKAEATTRRDGVLTCAEHDTCAYTSCNRIGLTKAVTNNGAVTLICSLHRLCSHPPCGSRDTKVYVGDGGARTYCEAHAEESVWVDWYA